MAEDGGQLGDLSRVSAPFSPMDADVTRRSPREASDKTALSSNDALPSLSLPKGGGAIRGIDEKFSANPATGTGTMTVPINVSAGRSGFGPQLALTYNSGAGNSPFGFGWTMSLPTITRKTDKGLPQYRDDQESDIFILSGVEDLMPALVEKDGEWVRDVTPSRSVYGNQYAIHRYRPRVEGLFARIERWINLANPQDTFWRSITKDNVTSWYGRTAGSRIADPANPAHIFSWLICESYDDKGNAVSYEYKQEDSEGVDLNQVNERNRTDATRSANQYIKLIFYGNRTPYFPDLNAAAAVPLPADWCFQLVFDYGDHDLLNPVPQDTGISWACRLDPFSTYRPTFEVRTYRLCRRALMFHTFPEDPNVGTDCLVGSTDLTHSAAPPTDPSQPFYSYLLAATQTSYRRDGAGGYLSDSLPPVEFGYTQATVNETVRDVGPESLTNLPYGLDGTNYRWVDLDGEGLSGILTEQAGSWFYKANLSPVNQQTTSGESYTLPLFAAMEPVASQPSTAALSQGKQQLFSVSGDGQLDLVEFESPVPGYYERTEDANWQPFTPFESLPAINWRDPQLKFIDLTGDGFPDLLISDGNNAFYWYQSRSTRGFGSGQFMPQALNEEAGPKLIFADGTESIFLADMSGDGLTDLVRIRSGEICYWPNRGYGSFGTKVTMDGAPLFDNPDLFDGRRIQLADIDGSGTADIIYFGGNTVQLVFNQSGNGWGTPRPLGHFPAVDSASRATALDLLGNGTACLLWSSPLPGNAGRQMRYIDLMGGQKPHLLVSVTNNLGATTVIGYAPSTKFYVADKLAGTPWVTRLPFPVQMVERVETFDYVSRNLFVTYYAYHDGYYDGVEREFRGFGHVDQWDTAEYATLSGSPDMPTPVNVDTASNVPPVLTKTWFHTGAYFGEAAVSAYMQHEYYSEGDPATGVPGLTSAQFSNLLLDDTVLQDSILLPDGTRLPYDFSPEELREACRALNGSLLRQEVYAVDGTAAADRPYSVSERNYTIETFQPQGPNQYGVFFSHPRETVDFHYERQLYPVTDNTITDPVAAAREAADPRVSHLLTLSVDQYGNALESASVGYGRRYLDPALSPADQATQSATLSTYKVNAYTNAVESDDVHRTPLAAQSSTYELIQVQPAATVPEVTNLFGFTELQGALAGLADGLHDISYEDLDTSGLIPERAYRRLIGQSRTYFRPDDLGAAASDPRALLPLGTLEALALPGAAYKLAFTAGLIAQVYQRGGSPLLPNPASELGSIAADGGGYVDLDGNGCWWIPAGRTYYMPTPPVSPQELDQARQHFFLPHRLEDPFENASTVTYDSNYLLVAQTTDALDNRATAVNDYRVLAPALITDANGNQGAVSFNVLGLVTATAVMGKPGQNLGDALTGFSPDLLQTQIDALYDAADPHSVAAPLLGNATTRIIYDIHGFYNSKAATPTDPTKWQPPFAVTIARETHVSALNAGEQSTLQIGFSYSDGLGREVQKKSRAEPGPVVDGGPVVDPRWVGTGWKIFNNKGKPVRQYEPFFSLLPTQGHHFEFGIQVGVSPIVCYDPPGRVVATLHPNHTWEKVVFDPWQETDWDVNDTVLQAAPEIDREVGDYFRRLPTDSYLPTWYTQRTSGSPDPNEQDAATKAAKHAKTPSQAFVDALGRTFLTIQDNGADGTYPTRIAFDIESNQRAISDALERTVMIYDYDMLRHRIRQASMEAGERWTLNDVSGKPVRAWDSRGHTFRTAYDALRRPTDSFMQQDGNAEALVGRTVYGESQPSPENNNLRTKIVQLFDQAGLVTSDEYDFKGNLLHTQRRLAQSYSTTLEWAGTVPLHAETYTGRTLFDALNRPIQVIASHSDQPGSTVNTIEYIFNEADLLSQIHVWLNRPLEPATWLDPATADLHAVTNIEYDAKGRRLRIYYGDGASTLYSYDPLSFRLATLVTQRDAAVFPGDNLQPPPVGWPGSQVQNLTYTYDPIGNITHIRDDAQQIIFFRNKRVEPSADYTYDAVYRVIRATGREHLGQVGGAPIPHSYNDYPRTGLWHPNDGNAMGTYIESYLYDAVGNFLQMQHQGSDPANPGWTRSYAYHEGSLLEPGRVSNRLSNTVVGTSNPITEPYSYDTHGNMLQMPQLQTMQWDFKDQLQMTRRQAVSPTDADGVQHQGERTWYVYDSSGQRVRKVTESSTGQLKDERIYLGSFEIYRENGSAPLARETLHIIDDKQRVALIESRTQGTDPGPQQLTRYQFGNHLGSVSLELDDQAQIISYEEYTPFGSSSYQAVRSQTETPKRYRYTGKERDEESGLYYHGARYYAPWLAKWIACDPAGLIDGTNLYAYVTGNPIRLLDPSGRQNVPPKATSPPVTTTIEKIQKIEISVMEETIKWAINPTGYFAQKGIENAGSTITAIAKKAGASDLEIDAAKFSIAMATAEIEPGPIMQYADAALGKFARAFGKDAGTTLPRATGGVATERTVVSQPVQAPPPPKQLAAGPPPPKQLAAGTPPPRELPSGPPPPQPPPNPNQVGFYGTPSGQLVLGKTPAGYGMQPHAAWRAAEPPDPDRLDATPEEIDTVIQKGKFVKLELDIQGKSAAPGTVQPNDPSTWRPSITVKLGDIKVAYNPETNNLVTVIKNRPSPDIKSK
jgi:RHS repeat-associated protein